MNNFYDDCFDMVPYEKPNLAVQQLAVNEDGEVTVESTLHVMGPVLAQQGITLSSDWTSSHVFMKGSGHPTTGDSDVDISCTGGRNGVTNKGTLNVMAGQINMNAGSDAVDITATLRNMVHIDVPGDNGSSLFLYGSKTIDSGIPAVELHASSGTTRDAGNLDVYASRTTFHGDTIVDPLLGNLFIPVTSAVGPHMALLRVFTDVGAPKLGFRWGGRWWCFTSSSNSAA